MSDSGDIKSILESLLFVNEKPIEVSELAKILGKDKREIIASLEELAVDYIKRRAGICIVRVAGGYQMCSNPSNESWIKKMYREKHKQKFSHASLETLAIIAYKQPITKMEIETIRGVNVDGIIKHLGGLGLIKIVGRKEVAGRPYLYATTRKFLEHFGLNSLDELPKLEEFTEFKEELT
ncbi:MAG: SMC-Scp complex subunit ScpB [Candidatus Omnitrophica bacterium 4484_70.1]|nr:MAG: SMC-Scp complex subunit ScpB [Candidatus Omnitrophica bacterium 4484_70.1]